MCSGLDVRAVLVTRDAHLIRIFSAGNDIDLKHRINNCHPQHRFQVLINLYDRKSNRNQYSIDVQCTEMLDLMAFKGCSSTFDRDSCYKLYGLLLSSH